MPQFNILAQPTTQLMLAANTLSLLERFTVFPLTGATIFEPGEFEKNEAISLARPKDCGEAQDYDPYSAVDADEESPGHVIVRLTLDRLFTKGFPVYSHDSDQARYVRDYSRSNANSVSRSVDNYMYNRCFIDLSSLASTGAIQYAKNPPIAIQWLEDSSGVLLGHTRSHIIRADAALTTLDVPESMRYTIMSPTSFADLFENAPTDEGRAGSIAGGTEILSQGLPMGSFIDRYGFMVGKSNAIESQTAIADISAGNLNVAIASVADDTTIFFAEDYTQATPLGAVQITLGAALTTPGLAVGDIIRIGAAGAKATAYGRVLRIDPGLTDIWVVPYDDRAQPLVAAQITPGTDEITAPQINNLNVGYHSEHLVYAFRRITAPSDGSGATLTEAISELNGMVLQVLTGDYKVRQFKESVRVAALCGAVPTDYRKGLIYACA